MTGIGTLDVFVEPGAADKSYVVFEQAADEVCSLTSLLPLAFLLSLISVCLGNTMTAIGWF